MILCVLLMCIGAIACFALKYYKPSPKPIVTDPTSQRIYAIKALGVISTQKLAIEKMYVDNNVIADSICSQLLRDSTFIRRIREMK